MCRDRRRSRRRFAGHWPPEDRGGNSQETGRLKIAAQPYAALVGRLIPAPCAAGESAFPVVELQIHGLLETIEDRWHQAIVKRHLLMLLERGFVLEPCVNHVGARGG